MYIESVINFLSTEGAHRRVDCTAKIANGVDAADAIGRVREAVARIPNVMTTPAPDVEVMGFTPEGPQPCVRPYMHADHYWQVYFDTHKAILQTFAAAGCPLPETPLAPRTR